MNKTSAKDLVKRTLEHSFDKGRFAYLVKNILNHVDEDSFTYQGNLIFDDFDDSIAKVERTSKYTDPQDRLLDILVVHLKKETSLERARTMQRNFVAKYLNGSRGGVLKDAALVAFVAPNGEDWRFSFVKMEYRLDEKGKVKEEFTPARRYSFLVGKNEHSHTAQSNLLPLLLNDEAKPTLAYIEQAFSVERVTKEFFEKYRELYLHLKEALDEIVEKDPKIEADFEGKSVDTVDFAKKLMGQIVFLYFLQKKGWFGVARGKEWGEGNKQFLRHLFPRAQEEDKNYFNRFLEPLFYEALRLERPKDYYDQFECRIPFLNGGLFDPINDYDWQDTDIEIPNEIFSNNELTKEGDTGSGILDVFDRYNFTVKEDEPLEKEVAVDPEMLGKVFENLLDIKDRKSKGTYYTPREIVHYMCQESLINALHVNLDGIIPINDLEALIKHGDAFIEHEETRIEKIANRKAKDADYKGSYKRRRLPASIEEYAELIDDELASMRVCDPAVGSGAFIVGMMNEIIRARRTLASYIDVNKEDASYRFKRHAIQHCLYGVDIDPGAVEIAKLRLWLSLVVDEEDRGKIKPLPNLDYKIIQGNSLLSVEKDLFNQELFNQLEKLKPLYFNQTNPKDKQKYKNQIDELISHITKGHKEFDFEVYFSEVFHDEKEGFDVVIGNPPYVVTKDNQLRELYKEGIYGRMNTYGLFIQRGLQLARNLGQLCFITPRTLLTDRYFSNLRKAIKRKSELKGIVLIADRYNTFESVLQECIIPHLVRKQTPSLQYAVNARTISVPTDLNDPQAAFSVGSDRVLLGNEFDGTFYIGNSEFDYQVFERINEMGVKLSAFGLKAETGKIQFDKCREYAQPDNSNDACRLIWAENIQRYICRESRHRVGKEWLSKAIRSAVRPNITGLGIVIQRITANEQPRRIIATLVTPEYFSSENVYSENHTNFIQISGRVNSAFLLGVLNSSLTEFVFRRLNSNTQVSAGELNLLPLPQASDETAIREIETLVSNLMKLGGVDCQSDDLKQAVEYEHQIDILVGSLYGITPSEVEQIQQLLPSYKTVYGV